jgi:hypothetical protein
MSVPIQLVPMGWACEQNLELPQGSLRKIPVPVSH